MKQCKYINNSGQSKALPTRNGYEYFTFRDEEQDNTSIEVKNTTVVGRVMNDVEKAIGDIEDIMQNIIRKNNITKEDLKNPTKSCHYQVISLEKATKALEKQLNNAWIPCSERMPQEFLNVLVSTKNGGIGIFYHREKSKDFADFRNIAIKEDWVTAWQTLPEPFKEIKISNLSTAM